MPQKSQGSRVNFRSRRGAVVPLMAIMMVFLVGMLAFAIDCGVITLARTQLQAAADAGALAGAAALSGGSGAATTAATTFAQSNYAGGQSVTISSGDVTVGYWNKNAVTFTAGGSPTNAVRVTCAESAARGNGLKLFFGRIFGATNANLSATAVAIAPTSNCGPFIGLNSVTISGGSYTNSYDSSAGAYSAGSAGSLGDVCSNGPISLSGGSTIIHGDAHPGVGYGDSLSGGSSVTGSTDPLTSALSEPAVDPGNAASVNNNAAIPLSQQGKTAVDSHGNFNLSGGDSVNMPPGTYYFGTLTLSGGSTMNISGKTIIYTTGNVDVSGGSLANSTLVPSNCELYAMGTKVVISGSSQYYGVVYAPSADITRSGGNSDFFGMMVGKTLTLSGGGGLHYDNALGALSGNQTGGQIVQ